MWPKKFSFLEPVVRTYQMQSTKLASVLKYNWHSPHAWAKWKERSAYVQTWLKRRQRQLKVISALGTQSRVWSYFGTGQSEKAYGGVSIWIEPWERGGFWKSRRGKWEVGIPDWANNMSKSIGVRNPEPRSWEFINDDSLGTLIKLGISAAKAHALKTGGDNQSRIREPTALSPSQSYLMPRTNSWKTEPGCPYFIDKEAESWKAKTCPNLHNSKWLSKPLLFLLGHSEKWVLWTIVCDLF